MTLPNLPNPPQRSASKSRTGIQFCNEAPLHDPIIPTMETPEPWRRSKYLLRPRKSPWNPKGVGLFAGGKYKNELVDVDRIPDADPRSMASVQEFLGSLLDRFEDPSQHRKQEPNPSLSSDSTNTTATDEEKKPAIKSPPKRVLRPYRRMMDQIPRDMEFDEIAISERRRKLPRRAREILAQWFNDHVIDPYPTDEERDELRLKTGLSDKQIHHWFTNRRKRDTKWRAKYLLRGRGRRPKTARADAEAAAAKAAAQAAAKAATTLSRMSYDHITPEPQSKRKFVKRKYYRALRSTRKAARKAFEAFTRTQAYSDFSEEEMDDLSSKENQIIGI